MFQYFLSKRCKLLKDQPLVHIQGASFLSSHSRSLLIDWLLLFQILKEGKSLPVTPSVETNLPWLWSKLQSWPMGLGYWAFRFPTAEPKILVQNNIDKWKWKVPATLSQEVCDVLYEKCPTSIPQSTSITFIPFSVWEHFLHPQHNSWKPASFNSEGTGSQSLALYLRSTQ